MASTEPYLASIELWPLAWAPQGYAACNGQLIGISTNNALYSLLGTTFGGDGRQTFGLPDMQGRIPIGMGVRDGVTFTVGGKGGASSVMLQPNNVPLLPHTHTATAQINIKVTDADGQINTPGGYYLAKSPGGDGYTDTPTDGAFLNGPTASIVIQPNGASAASPVNILPPYLVLNYIIAVSGLYPQRP